MSEMIYCLSDFVTLVILLKLNARFLSHSTKKIYYPRSRGERMGLGDQEDALDHFLLTLTSPFGQTVASFIL